MRPLTVGDEAAVAAMVARCSRMTLFRRFHSFTDGAAYLHLLFSNRPGFQSLLAWHGSRCIAIGNLADYGHRTADLGVLVEDAWQRQGVGFGLVSVLFDSARTRGLCRAHADVLGDDQFILRTLRRYGPMTVSVQTGTYSVDIDLGPVAQV
jgi:GNAT superfamily N-acetyltransferase